MRKIIAKIYLKHIKQNALFFKRQCKTRLCAVVKADAYGHGAEEVANALSGIADYFAVSLLSEALAIRVAACSKPILILSPPLSEEEVLACARNSFVITVADFATAKLVKKVVRAHQVCVQVHLKGNIGMNRYGSNASWLGRICKYLQEEKGVAVQGFYSHLYCNKLASAYKCRSIFMQMQKVVLRYYPNAICHLSATFGATLGQDFAFDMVRVGLGLYGYLPQGTDKEFAKCARLKKGMQVFAQVSATRRYAFGGAGYGKENAPIKKGAPVHVLRFGYADGFLRNKQNGAVGAKKSVNALCMDATVRRGKAKRGAWQAVLVDAEKTAKEQNTIVYEVLCRMGQRAERIYENGEIDDGERWLRECEKRKKATARIYEKTPRR